VECGNLVFVFLVNTRLKIVILELKASPHNQILDPRVKPEDNTLFISVIPEFCEAKYPVSRVDTKKEMDLSQKRKKL
jgi:hypothetical protein